ncbi:MAG: substrate-binding domain-containing protein, partial [Acidimicrobiia bacterium]|nr:substrate-binding domain-containing protein [Acidimicrobiia bacterium]
MRRSLKRVSVLSVALMVAAVLAACGGSSKKSSSPTTTSGGGSSANLSVSSFTSDFSAMSQLKGLAGQGKGLVGVLLPDTTTSARYVSFDAPYLTKAFQTAGFTQFKVDNAQGSASTMQTQAEADITSGASVLIVDPLDSGSGAAIENNAVSKGVKVIDYDRLTKGGPADRIYVSFDNVKVG